MIKEVRARFHQLLEGNDPGAIHELIQRQALQMGVTYGQRSVCQVLEPLFMEKTQYELVLERAETCLRALKKAARHAQQSSEIWSALRFSADEEDLLAVGGGYQDHDQIGRLDSFLNQAGEPVFLEYNGESPGGIAYGDVLGRIFDGLPIIQDLASEFSMSRRPVASEVVRTLRDSYYKWARANGIHPQENPQVAIIDLAGIPTIGEFEIFRALFENTGMRCKIGTPGELEVHDNQVYCDGFRADIIYRRLLTSDLLAAFDRHHPLVDIMKRSLAFVANGFGGYLLSHKGLFAVLSDPELAPQDLTPQEWAAVRSSLPWTRLLRDTSTTGPKSEQVMPLRQIAIENQSQLVIKQALGYGGRDVCLGWTVSPGEWAQTFDGAQERPHVIQERLHIPQTEHPAWVDGSLQYLKLRFDVDPYTLGGKRAHGLGIRLASNDLLNVASGAGSAIPVYVVSDS